jgi:hypothetical protein
MPEPQGSAIGLASAVLPSSAAGGLHKALLTGAGLPDAEENTGLKLHVKPGMLAPGPSCGASSKGDRGGAEG